MVMSIRVTKDVLNLADLQEKLDQTVFDYVDTTQNWERAHENLHALYSQIVEYFEAYVTSNDGVMPKSSHYWVLFMDIAARVVYFNNFVKQHILTDLDAATRNDIVRAYETVAKILPNNQFEENEEFFKEVDKSLQQITGDARSINKAPYTLTECLQNFYEYIKTL